MQALEQHEIFEIEVLDRLSKAGLLRPLIFGGGTMLRLCHELPRYSIDLDFWFHKKIDHRLFHSKLSKFINTHYRLTDSKNKHHTLLYEFRGKTSPRKLKIEIRKELLLKGREDHIAYSKHATTQVLVKALSLPEMARRKIEAIRSRNEIRDFFDLEFLFRKGVMPPIPAKDRAMVDKKLRAFNKRDFTVVLGSLLDGDAREYYTQNGFTYLQKKLE